MVGLVELSVNNNPLKVLDLQALSKCVNLKSLKARNIDCAVLDISPLFNCGKLRELDVDDDVILQAYREQKERPIPLPIARLIDRIKWK